MKKVAVVNLSQMVDVGAMPEFGQGIAVLREYGLEVADYATGRAEPLAMVDGLHAAVYDSEVGFVLTYSGGSAAIRCLDFIDWGSVGACGKVFAGLSDFTHFVWKALEAGATCAYGLSLTDFAKFRTTEEAQRPAISLLRSGEIEPVAPSLISGEDVIRDWAAARIVGGHSFITLLMAAEIHIDMDNRVLMLEHHYHGAESLDDVRYWSSALTRTFDKRRPLAVLLGHSMVSGEDGNLLPAEAANEAFCEGLAPLGLPVYYVDHFKSIVPLRP